MYQWLVTGSLNISPSVYAQALIRGDLPVLSVVGLLPPMSSSSALLHSLVGVLSMYTRASPH